MPIKTKDIDVPRLLMTMQKDRLALQRYRQERYDMVRQYAGNHYSDEGATEKIHVNLMSLYVSVVGRNLIAKNPRFMYSTFNQGMKPTVAALQAWANKEVENMELANTIQRIVTDALFSVGICKVALATPADSASFSWNLVAGQPFCERVDLDDFVCDMHGGDLYEAGYIGHRFRVPIDVVKNSKLYGPGRKLLEPQVDRQYNLEGDEVIGLLGRSTYSNEEFEDFVDLWEVYIPRHRVIMTFADDQMIGATANYRGSIAEPLRTQGWVGPDTGPYHFLSYGVVPGNIMPKAPLQDLIDLHMATNNCFRKVVRMVERIKELTAVQAGSSEDGQRVMDASDGQMVIVNNIDKIKPFVQGGTAINTVMVVANALKDLFSFMGGNLELMGGRGAQSKTATQDKMLNENAGASIADMQDRTVHYVSRIGKAIGWYWWNNPIDVQESKHSLQGLPEMEITRKIYPGRHPDPNVLRRKGPMPDIAVDPYSLQHGTPQSRMAALDQVMTTQIMPMMQQMQAQGIAVDLNAWLKIKAALMDMPELQEILTIQEPPDKASPTGTGEEDQASGPANTTRTYNRVSMPGRTAAGDRMNQQNALLGINPGGNPNKTASANGHATGSPMG